ncbi:hypothetical protein Patl1_16180 [Pistacia atlantica]|uniref:Uncharacterized protein n=1 Tax=Pistacia atlantica TaxID=434234 RepID=A0ACC1B8P8_9ROSI|nr:hypothetical protein Patl1_16180 [Pistacia atlantica]
MEEEDKIEEGRVRLLGCNSGGESRWVDGSEVESESPPWSVLQPDGGSGDGYGSMRRRLAKRPNRLDSLDVEAMEIASAHGYHSKDGHFEYGIGIDPNLTGKRMNIDC